MVDDILFSKYILNQLEPEEMDKVEKMLIDDNEAEAIVHASIVYSQENIDLISEFLDEDEMNFDNDESSLENNARNQGDMDSTKVNKNQINMKTPLSDHDKQVIADLVKSFHENEDINQTFDDRLISFYQTYCPQMSEDDVRHTIGSMRRGIKLFSDNLSQAFNEGVDTLSSKLDTIGEGLPLEERYNLFLNILALLNTIDNKNFNEDELSDERTLDSFRDELCVQGLVSESDVNELKKEILHTLSESSFSVITTVNADEILKSANNVADLTRLTKEDTMHEILVTSAAMHIAMQNGQIEAESEMATPEAIAVGVAAGYEEMKVISQLEKGEIDDEGAWESIKLISAVVGVTLFMIAITAVAALTSAATLIGFLEMFGSSMVVAIMGGIVAMSVGYLILLPIINNIEWFLEKGGELLDKVVDNLRMRVIPTIKKRIEVFTEKVSNLIHSGVVWVKSLFSRRRQGQRENNHFLVWAYYGKSE